MVGVILAAGDGRRLKESVKEACCKPLIKVKEKRLIEYALDNLIALDIRKVFIVVGKDGEIIKKVLGNKYKDLEIFYVVQTQQIGLMNAFVQAIDVLGSDETIIFQLSDEVFTDLKVADIKKCLQDREYDFYCGITFEDDADKIRNNYSVYTHDGNVISKCIEKPTEVTNNIKGTGFCIFNSEALKVLNNKENEKTVFLHDLCDYINYMISDGKKGLALHIAEKEFNVNTFADLFEVQSFLYVN